MLTPEEKVRIEEEEQRHHAEDEYRAKIRAGLKQPSASRTLAKSGGWSFLRILGAVLAAAAILLIIANFAARSNAANSRGHQGAHHILVTDSVVSGQTTARHGGAVYYKIVVSQDMMNAVLIGEFNASGGDGNDVIAVVADEMNYTNWINGHQAQVLWATQGRQTTARFQVRLQPGTYYLAFSNKFSFLTDKDVSVTAALKYSRVEN